MIRTDILASRLGINIQDLPDKIGIGRASLFCYRKGTREITAKTWLKLAAAEESAGLCEKKAGDVVRTGEVKDFPTPPKKRSQEEENAEHIFPVSSKLDAYGERIASLEAQVKFLSLALAALLPPTAPPEEGAGRSKKAGSVTRHRSVKIKSDNPSLSADAWLIDRDERGGDHDD